MKHTVAFFIAFVLVVQGFAQKPFTEGIITYDLTLESADHKMITGTYIFTIKGMEIKKELQLSNGYHDVTLVNCSTGAVHSLQSKNGKNYAIELSMADMSRKQDKYSGYTLSNQQANSKTIAGMQSTRANVTYRDGTTGEVYYTSDWSPAQPITFEQFPSAKFLPLAFTYKENGLTLRFLAADVVASPVENSVFKIPADCKMISYKEYKELSQ